MYADNLAFNYQYQSTPVDGFDKLYCENYGPQLTSSRSYINNTGTNVFLVNRLGERFTLAPDDVSQLRYLSTVTAYEKGLYIIDEIATHGLANESYNSFLNTVPVEDRGEVHQVWTGAPGKTYLHGLRRVPSIDGNVTASSLFKAKHFNEGIDPKVLRRLCQQGDPDSFFMTGQLADNWYAQHRAHEERCNFHYLMYFIPYEDLQNNKAIFDNKTDIMFSIYTSSLIYPSSKTTDVSVEKTSNGYIDYQYYPSSTYALSLFIRSPKGNPIKLMPMETDDPRLQDTLVIAFNTYNEKTGENDIEDKIVIYLFDNQKDDYQKERDFLFSKYGIFFSHKEARDGYSKEQVESSKAALGMASLDVEKRIINHKEHVESHKVESEKMSTRMLALKMKAEEDKAKEEAARAAKEGELLREKMQMELKREELKTEVETLKYDLLKQQQEFRAEEARQEAEKQKRQFEIDRLKHDLLVQQQQIKQTEVLFNQREQYLRQMETEMKYNYHFSPWGQFERTAGHMAKTTGYLGDTLVKGGVVASGVYGGYQLLSNIFGHMFQPQVLQQTAEIATKHFLGLGFVSSMIGNAVWIGIAASLLGYNVPGMVRKTYTTVTKWLKTPITYTSDGFFECAFSDFADCVGNIKDNIINGFFKLGNAIINGFKNLFTATTNVLGLA